MWPLLKIGGGSGTERDVAIVANISARVGSIGDNRLGGWHSYRASKSALNQRKLSSLKSTHSIDFLNCFCSIFLLEINIFEVPNVDSVLSPLSISIRNIPHALVLLYSNFFITVFCLGTPLVSDGSLKICNRSTGQNS